MKRLIDADELKLKMMKSHKQHGNTSQIISALERDIRIIDEQPTAYDVDKVVEELKQIKTIDFRGSLYSAKKITSETIRTVDKAIDIVKQGGVNDK
jgi:hypothetical protein